MSKRSTSRQAATRDVLEAGRALGGAAIMFHSIVAEKQGLSPTEEKTLDLLQRFGPLSAGELASKCGLAAPSVTGLINRLEKKGFVERLEDPLDRRKVRVRYRDERTHEFVPLFVDLVTGMQAICQRYSADELALVAKFMNEAAACQIAAAAKLSGAEPA
ncbi:MarR family transcriptional regulator [Nannocystaceae bacterium ST9]